MRRRLLVIAGLTLLLGASSTVAGPAAPTLPPDLPMAERSRLTAVATGASIATRVEGEPFLARREILEYLLDHLAFTTDVIRALRFGRLRIWPTPEGLLVDEGWGTTGRLSVAYAAGGTRVLYLRGQHKVALLPAIRGDVLLTIDYQYVPADPGRDLVKTTVAAYLKLDSRILSAALSLGGPVARRKADREARDIVKLFARVSRAVDADPAGVYAKLRDQPGIPRAELDEFRSLLAIR